MKLSAAVLGASGYAGGEVVRLLDEHPFFEVSYMGAHSQAGGKLSAVHPHLTGGERGLGSNDPADVPHTDIAFLGLPHGASVEVATELAARGTRVVDLGSDFRMDTPQRYELAYGSPHPLPDHLADWVYGLPELFGSQIVGATRVAAPGCYPTAALLAAVPLIATDLVDCNQLVVNALSGVSGAGRSLRDDLLFGAVDEGVRAYAVGVHRHRPEIEMGIELATGRTPKVTFTPHLIPMQRGILSTLTVPVDDGVDEDDLRQALDAAYHGHPFVEVIEQSPQTRWVTGSNRALVAPFVDERTGNAVVISAIDNLLKGAAGQAVQIANLMCGFEPTVGLPRSGWMP